MQTPAPFDYERATSVEGAIASLTRLGSGARIIAGGHSLLPMMKLRLANPEHLIDINDLDELDYIREQGDEVRIGALTRHVAALARREPALLVFEDLHWVDATSLEFLTLLVERARSMRLMLIVTFRPEFAPPWVGQSHVTMLTLSRLDAEDAEVMIARVTGGRALPAEVLD